MTDFERIIDLARQEQRLQSAIAKQRSKAEGVGSPRYSDMPKGPGNKQRLEEDVVQLVTLQEEHDAVMQELRPMRTELKRAIAKLRDPVMRTVMTMRYIQYRKIADIAELLTYSDRQIQRLLGDGQEQVHRRQSAGS